MKKILVLNGNSNSDLEELAKKTLPGGGQSSPFNSRSQARIKEEGWRQEGHPAIKPLL